MTVEDVIRTHIGGFNRALTTHDLDTLSRVDHTHVTAPTRFVESDGIRFAYRRFGQESGIPLLFFQQHEPPQSRGFLACRLTAGLTHKALAGQVLTFDTSPTHYAEVASDCLWWPADGADE